MNLRRLKNLEYDHVEKIASQSGISLDQCPTCLATEIEVAPGVFGWESGTVEKNGEQILCDCKTQINLRKHYLLANIGDQYMRLDWDDYLGPDYVRETIGGYLDRWTAMKLNGMGLEISSPSLGVGKTYAATYIGKELIKTGERVYFIDFLSFISLLNKDQKDRLQQEEMLWDTTVLILDDVREPYTQAQNDFFASRFEELIRHRQNFNKVTIVTTNLTQQNLQRFYPRVYSLLTAKQIRLPLPEREDARLGEIADRNLELSTTGSWGPIT